MIKKTKLTLVLIFKIIQNKRRFLFWFFVRFISSLLPLLSIFLFSKVIKSLENQVDFSHLFFLVLTIFTVYIIDNFLRLRSIFKLDECISSISFDIHLFFTKDLHAENKEERHQSVQAIRNFADASALTLTLFRQPGIDSVVSLTIIPFILFFLDTRIFVLEIAYILIYMVIDYYTTQKYIRLRDAQNTKVETYYGKLQESNDIDLEQKTYTRHFSRLCNWNFIEWFLLQNSAVFFYSLILAYSVISVTTGAKQISDIILIMGYISSTQGFLNSFSSIKDSLADMTVAVDHLAKNKSISVIDLDDLV